MNRQKFLMLVSMSVVLIAQSSPSIAQNSAVPWSSFDMGFASTGIANLQVKSALGQPFVGVTQQSNTRVEGGFLADTLLRGILVGVIDRPSLPSEFSLRQNYPNPFNPSTVIRYALPVSSHVKLIIYNLLGQEVKTLIDRTEEPGEKSVSWDAANTTTGVYFYRLISRPVDSKRGVFSDLRKMVVVK